MFVLVRIIAQCCQRVAGCNYLHRVCSSAVFLSGEVRVLNILSLI